MYKPLICISTIVLSLCLWMPASAATSVDVGVSIGTGGVTGFHLSIGNYYGAPERELVVIRDRGIPDDDLPVVYFIARKAMVSPYVIVDLRMRGMSWWEISERYGISVYDYYVPGQTIIACPQDGGCFGYSDFEIVFLVNLRFYSERYDCDPVRIITLHKRTPHFWDIDRDLDREYHGRPRYGFGEGRYSKKQVVERTLDSNRRDKWSDIGRDDQRWNPPSPPSKRDNPVYDRKNTPNPTDRWDRGRGSLPWGWQNPSIGGPNNGRYDRRDPWTPGGPSSNPKDQWKPGGPSSDQNRDNKRWDPGTPPSRRDDPRNDNRARVTTKDGFRSQLDERQRPSGDVKRDDKGKDGEKHKD